MKIKSKHNWKVAKGYGQTVPVNRNNRHDQPGSY